MNFNVEDKLKLQHLAGGNIVTHAPVFSAQGRFLFVRCGLKVQVFVSSTGELTRELVGANAPLISLELEPKQQELLVGCTTAGELLRWHWRTGVLQKTTPIQFGAHTGLTILTCNLLNLYKESESACAFVTAKRKSGEHLSWFIINTATGSIVDVSQKCGLKLKIRTPLVAVGLGQFKYVVIAQAHYIYFLNYKTWQFERYINASKVPVTCVRFSPAEELVAIGDEQGRIFLWRQFGSKQTMVNALYHWHHTAISSLAFSPSGSGFYSSGKEAVLVKWTIADARDRNFLPRMSSPIRHVLVSDGNEHVVVCTEDNAVQFIGASDNLLKSTLQYFTYGAEDSTGQSMFPLGLCLNPRTNTLVLNGRVGHLQFYSAYSKSLLYNLRVIQSNVQSQESDRIIHNSRVTRAAFNIDWMATGEVYNDEQNYAQVRLKFWHYHEKLRSYELNTNIELPHEEGFAAIVFSNQFKVENLRCATAGKDRQLKLFGLVDSENIYKKRSPMWNCLAQTSYKNYPIASICFSQDGSILAAGFGNTLCLYDARSLLLLRALTAPGGYDGVVAKAQLRLNQALENGARKQLSESRQRLFFILKALLISDDQQLMEEARQLIARNNSKAEPPAALDEKTKARIFAHIMQMAELGLHQKLQLFRRFGIECSVNETQRQRLLSFLQPIAGPARLKQLQGRLQRVHQRHRFKAKQRLALYCHRKQQYEEIVREELLPLFGALQLDQNSQPKVKRKRPNSDSEQPEKSSLKAPPPLQSLAMISQVQFGAGAQAHLVTICTESRVLVWNLLTLRLQAGLKLSVKQLAFDPATNLLAAVTHSDELHIFQPNVPLPVYQRRELPKLYGLIWLPRRHPKQRSINVDWQAQSTLHMLTQEQEIVYLSTTADDEPTSISFAQPAATPTAQSMQYATFGSYAVNQQQQLDEGQQRSGGPLIVGRGRHSAVHALTNLSAHTMPAMSLICGEFIKSMLTPAETATRHGVDVDAAAPNMTNGIIVNGNGHPHDDSDSEEEGEEEQDTRKALLVRNATLEKIDGDDLLSTLDAQLQRIAALETEFKL